MNTVFYLVLIWANGMTTIPEPIATEQACEVAGENWKAKAPKSNTPKYACVKIETRLE